MQTVTHSTSSSGFAPWIDSGLGVHPLFVSTSLIISIGLLVLVHVILARAVANDVARLARTGRRVHYLGPAGWACVVLFLGLFGLGAHWVMHYSTFRDAATDRSTSDR